MPRRMAVHIDSLPAAAANSVRRRYDQHVPYLDTRATYPFVEFLSPQSAAALFHVKGTVRHTVKRRAS